MRLGVIFNRTFRIKHNPLFEYVIQHQNEIDQLYLILPIEDLSDAANVKRDDYEKVVKGFVHTLNQHEIYPHMLNYDQLGVLVDDLALSHVLMPQDIMSYHQSIYDYPHMKRAFENHQVKVVGQRVNHYFQPSQTLNQQQQPYKVFTSFYKANRKNLVHRRYKTDAYKQVAKIAEKGINQVHLQINDSEDMEKSARQDWETFLNTDIFDYKKLTDDILQDFVSGLSRFLAYGLLDIREIMNDLLAGYDSDEINCEAFIREVMFREFYYVLMTKYPQTAIQSFSEKYRGMQWSNNQAHFESWKSGQTGYPIVDAAMKKLNRTGLMHNRLRMVVSQFLTKHLFIDWTWGEAYFRQYLLDYDNASNVHGWQWSASTGTDAVPYFRMFNPIRQSERFDPNGYFIKSELDVFDDVHHRWLHDPTRYKAQLKENHHIEIGKDYPEVIVEHKKSRDYVMQQFKNIGPSN
ncbi:deoxyribodipyrimidine photo-lyase [Staphylococcus coagulans]|uniref:cryptochrome/photolyase family protein n=1 Tax=Staphylococcus coagulans TaxID=74706 RepID=UPI001BE60869|nr:deoxyribodipyrimidine photo-lyase [Staphylococcus coagulans]MBT2814657.1 deoxyribodipyrimidine photo-lyase [Staphylococcus coagulans]MBT2816827.1 deoxyribodipyrimidine photo-lyase [Staphylococcus coagulans]MBT2837466.1 deoxyribodipyrimidine photo-lyase [Staphylococcus coagulans]MBT2841994.1 deoxyribodipyrimidine photo-lyase [Staphylococcus coagulans]MBT2848735.1 deoxyribodipyrimidine photo-lyase [Staphylococcus coagulans]